MSFGVGWFRLLTFIFHFMIVVLECVNLILLGSAGVCQTCIINESYRIGGDNAKV